MHLVVRLQHLPKHLPNGPVMRLADVRDRFARIEFPAKGEQAHPDRDAVLAARSTIQAAVVDDEFLADCIALELQLIADTEFRRGLVPFLTIPELGIRFAFGYWPPGGTPGPHEHTAWTITAVCRNQLEVLTYDRSESYRRRKLVPKNQFPAAAGRVGYIYDPSIHAPINTSPDWSLSLHVVSPRDGEPIEPCEPPAGLSPRERRLPPPTHPYASAMAARIRSQGIHVLARALAEMNVDSAPTLLDQCAALGSHATRKLAAQVSGCVTGRAPAPYLLRRTHPDLTLSHRVYGDRVTLVSEAPGGTLDELTADALAADAIAYAAKEPVFDVRDLPGRLTDDERTQIAETLEDSGLFTKAA
jgi:hypothetical protein